MVGMVEWSYGYMEWTADAGAAIHNDDQSAAMDDGRIAGGVTSAPKAFPYYVAVTVNEQHKCGGFLYNDRFIITAASCITDPPGYYYITLIAY